MDIYDPIAIALGLPQTIDIKDYPKIEDLVETQSIIIPWNKGRSHVEGQTESLQTRLSNGTHNFIINRMKYARKRVENGSYSEVAKRTSAKQLENGTHPFLFVDVKRQQAKLLEEGKHHSQVVHTCPHCGKTGKGNAMKKHHFDNCKLLQHSDSSDLLPVTVIGT
jgi:hypothetical protein